MKIAWFQRKLDMKKLRARTLHSLNPLSFLISQPYTIFSLPLHFPTFSIHSPYFPTFHFHSLPFLSLLWSPNPYFCLTLSTFLVPYQPSHFRCNPLPPNLPIPYFTPSLLITFPPYPSPTLPTHLLPSLPISFPFHPSPSLPTHLVP